MDDVTSQMPDDQRSFNAARSHKNVEMAYDNAKAVGQSLILINGGAATAVLAFLSKAGGAGVPWLACLGLFLYAVGVAVGTYMLFALYKNNMSWNRYFQALYWGQKDVRDYHDDGLRWEDKATYAGAASSALFLISSLCIALAFAFGHVKT